MRRWHSGWGLVKPEVMSMTMSVIRPILPSNRTVAQQPAQHGAVR
jgi:hypothetical protein